MGYNGEEVNYFRGSVFNPWEMGRKCSQWCLAGTKCLVTWGPFSSLERESSVPGRATTVEMGSER